MARRTEQGRRHLRIHSSKLLRVLHAQTTVHVTEHGTGTTILYRGRGIGSFYHGISMRRHKFE